MYFLKIDPNNLMHHKIRPNSQIGPRVINHQINDNPSNRWCISVVFIALFSIFLPNFKGPLYYFNL